MNRGTAALGVGWALVLPVELWFGASGFVAFEPWRIAAEAAQVAILAVNHAWFAPDDWRRSPLIPGVGLATVALVVTWPADPLRLSLLALGAGIAAMAMVRGLDRLTRRAPLVTAVLGTLVGGTVARAVQLTAPLPDETTVMHPLTQLGSEFRPMLASGTGSTGPRIVFLTVDTLRADRMVTMRSWQRLAERGRSWERAMATASWTLPSMASIATGVEPGVHGASARADGTFQGIRPGTPTLPAELAAAGYTCAAVFNNSWLSPEMGFGAGFHRYVHSDDNRRHRLALAGSPATRHLSGTAAVDQAIRAADALPATGAFLWVHFLDPHMPYAHAEGALFEDAEGALREGKLLDAAAKDEIRLAYDREVALLDAELTRLLDHLEATGWMDGLVVLTADHGEEFWDHGRVEHGHSHHGEVLDVGLVVVAPGLAAGPGTGIASLVDLASTARAVAGIAPRGFDLRSPLPPDRVATAWGNVFFQVDASARAGSRRVIVHEDGSFEGYDLANDPREQAPLTLAEDDPLVRATRQIAAPARQDESEINREALKALGYLAP